MSMVFSAIQLLPVYPNERTFAVADGMSQRANIGNQELRIRAVCRACRFLSELCLEVDTAQDDAGGSAFELPSQEFASGTLFNPIA